MKYIIVNKNTGELEDNCSICSIGEVGTSEDFNAFLLDNKHIMFEITEDEFEEINNNVGQKFQDTGEESEFSNVSKKERFWHPVYLKKIDMKKASKFVDTRKQIDGKPEKIIKDKKETIA